MIVNDARNQRPNASRLAISRIMARRKGLLQAGIIVLAVLAGAGAHRAGTLGVARASLGSFGASLSDAAAMMRHPSEMIDAWLRAPDLPTLRIDMGYQHYNRIREKRDEAVRRGLLFASELDLVPARIAYNDDDNVRVRMRLKGDLTDHFESEREKWSYRIETRDEGQLMGMRRFSIQHPVTRNYLAEWGWLENLRLEGVLAPRYKFVNVIFNGTSLGKYAVEEHFSKELLEAQGRREGVLVNMEETHYWLRRDKIGEEPRRYDLLQGGGFRNTLIETRRANVVRLDSALVRQRNAAIGLLRGFQEGTLPASAVFDAKLLGRYLALTDLWEARHALIWNNMNFYYNPVSARLEPIGFDGDAQKYIDVTNQSLLRPLTAQALEDPEVARHYARELERVSRPEYIQKIEARLNPEYEALRRALWSEFPAVREQHIWDALRQKQQLVRRLFEPSRMVLAMVVDSAQTPGDSVNIEVRNILALPVEVVGLRISGTTVDARDAYVGGAGAGGNSGANGITLAGRSRVLDEPFEYAVFRVRAPRIVVDQDPFIGVEVLTRIAGADSVQATPAQPYAPIHSGDLLPAMPTVNEALTRHPFLDRAADGKALVVRRGTWDVKGDLVVPAGMTLRAGPGTTLRFAKEAVLYSRSPLLFEGTAAAPVRLEPQDSSWPGVVVLEADAPSMWTHVDVLKTRGVARGGWIMTGGITFYQSPIHILRSRIDGTAAEDAINVIRTDFSFRDSEFGATTSDAFDGDFAQGLIENCRFADIVGDAIDVSGSRVTIRNIAASNIGDKAISVGEDSRVEAYSTRLTDVSIGVAAKDLSTVRLVGLTLERVKLAGMAAYVQKSEYGPSRIDGVNVRFLDASPRTLIQPGSIVILDGSTYKATEADLREMHKAGMLGN